jgi:hypothetical protein
MMGEQAEQGSMVRRDRPRVEGAPVGPGSLLWSIAGDPRSLMPGTSAGILQGPAIRRGALSTAWPEGTPHLDPGDPTTVVVAPPNPRQRTRRPSPASASSSSVASA